MDLYATCCSQKMLQNFRMQEGWKRGMEKIYIRQILIKRKLEYRIYVNMFIYLHIYSYIYLFIFKHIQQSNNVFKVNAQR